MFEQRLQSLLESVEGAEAVSLVARDGITVESFSRDPGIDLEALAAELLTRTQVMTDNHRDLGLGELSQVTVTTDRYSVLVGAVTSEYYLLMVLAGKGNFGRARFELRRAGLRFEEDLY